MEPVTWSLKEGSLPAGISVDTKRGELIGKPAALELKRLRLQAIDAAGQSASREFELRIAPAQLRRIGPDDRTVVLWDWQGPGGRYIRDVMGDSELTLTWVNTKGDTRLPRPGWGLYPHFIGGGRRGLRGAPVEPEGGPSDHRGRVDGGGVGPPGRPHRRLLPRVSLRPRLRHLRQHRTGGLELYLSDQGSSDGSMAPGVHFFGAEPDQALRDLHPYSRPEGTVADPKWVGIRDTAWHHIAWQYSYAEDLHQLFLDGRLIWEMKSPDGRRLVNNRRHLAQFSVGSRLNGRARYGGKFNWLGFGNFFGQIGEIRISRVRRY